MSRSTPLTVRAGLELATWKREPREHEREHFIDAELQDADLAGHRFIDCVFERCNLAMAQWRNVALQGVVFRECKLLGADLSVLRALMLAVTFDECRLDYVNFAGLRLAKTSFTRCSLREASFIGTDLSNASFTTCDLERATFGSTNLTGADLRGANGLVLDPDKSRLRKAKFTAEGLAGLLTKYDLDIEL